MRYVEDPLKFKKSVSSIQISGQSPNTFKPAATLPRAKSTTVAGNLIIGDVYEMCDATPAELAAEKALKNKGPRPKPPAPYQKSRSLDRSAKHSVSSSSDVESSPGSPLLQEGSSPEVLKPPPRRKYSIPKPKTNKQST